MEQFWPFATPPVNHTRIEPLSPFSSVLLLISQPLLSVFMPPPNVVLPEAYRFCPVHPCVYPCVHPETLLTRYLAEYLTHFHQTYVNDALWDRDECFTVCGQKVKGQGHSGIKYAGTALSGLVNTMS